MGDEDKERENDKDILRRCTTCRGPVKGHEGPTGKNCIFIASTADSEAEKNGTYLDIDSPVPDVEKPVYANNATATTDEPSMKNLVTMLASQMSSLNNAMQGLIAGQEALHMALQKVVKASSESFIDGQSKESCSAYLPPTAATNEVKILTNGKPVPARLAKAATEGEFIDLSEFLPTKDSYELYVDAEDSKRKKTAKSIDSFDTWLTAWTVYESIVVEKTPNVYQFLVSYRQFIQSCFRKYIWQAVNMYDIRHRLKLSMTKSFEFHKVNADLFVSILDSTSVRTDARRCF